MTLCPKSLPSASANGTRRNFTVLFCLVAICRLAGAPGRATHQPPRDASCHALQAEVEGGVEGSRTFGIIMEFNFVGYLGSTHACAGTVQL